MVAAAWVGGRNALWHARHARTCGRALKAKKDSPSADRNRRLALGRGGVSRTGAQEGNAGRAAASEGLHLLSVGSGQLHGEPPPPPPTSPDPLNGPLISSETDGGHLERTSVKRRKEKSPELVSRVCRMFFFFGMYAQLWPWQRQRFNSDVSQAGLYPRGHSGRTALNGPDFAYFQHAASLSDVTFHRCTMLPQDVAARPLTLQRTEAPLF